MQRLNVGPQEGHFDKSDPLVGLLSMIPVFRGVYVQDRKDLSDNLRGLHPYVTIAFT